MYVIETRSIVASELANRQVNNGLDISSSAHLGL